MTHPPLALLAAAAMLGASFLALLVSLGESGGRSVQHLNTVPGVPQSGGVLAASAPRADSPFAVYSPPPGADAAAPAPAASPPAAAPPPPPAPKGRPPHH